MKIQNVLFDLDGTLLNTTKGVLESVKYAISKMEYEEPSTEELLTFIGPPIQNSFKRVYGCNDEMAQQAAEIFRDYYKNKALLLAEPYYGIYDACDELRKDGLKLAVATYKREDYAIDLLKHYRFHEYCDVMHGADNENVLKKENIVEICINELNGTQANSVLVGDTLHDAVGAYNAGIPFIAVTYGFGFKDKNELTQYPNIGVADTTEDIVSLIKEYNSKQ